jgi:glutaminyl-tRNA synthetase
LRRFCEQIGVAKFNSTVDVVVLENALREDLNRRARRAMAVLRPLRLVLEDYPQDRTELLEADNNPEDPSAGKRLVPFSRELWVERDDWRLEPPKDWFRLAPGREVRLRYAYYVTVREVRRDPRTGEVIELVCRHDPASRGGGTSDGRKVKGTIHWVCARAAHMAEVRLYDHLFAEAHPEEPAGGGDFKQGLNPASLEHIDRAFVEPELAGAAPLSHWQFERLGYFTVDSRDSRPGRPVFNRAVTLKDTWAKLERRSQAAPGRTRAQGGAPA